MPDSDDTSLLQSFCASRDEAAFTRLVRRYLPMVQAVARRRLGSPALAEEAAQNAFALLARKAAAVACHPERLGAWLHRAAFLEASNLARNEARFARIPVHPAAAQSHPTDAMNRPDIFDQLDAALQSLPETDRELLLRRYWKGEDFRTIAAALGRSVESCTKRVERSLTKLGARLGGALPAVTAASALAALKPSASAATMTAAQRVAEGALQSAGSAAGGAGGIFTGGILAASLAAIVCGWWIGSQPAEASPPAARSRILPPENRTPLAAARPLPPREPVARPALQDVLASIDAGRWGPLVAFLEEATPAELSTMLEDRLTYDSYWWEPHPDADYEDYPGHLMLRRWTEIDPAGALEWSRGEQLGGKQAAVQVFEEWFKSAPDAAAAAFARMPESRQRSVARLLSYGDAEPRDVLVAAFPKLRWALENHAFHRRNEDDPAHASAVVEQALDGMRHPDRDLKLVTHAFGIFARTDPQGALEKAARLPADPLRTAALDTVRSIAPSSEKAGQPDASVPRSWERVTLTGRMTRALAPAAAAALVKELPPGSERDAAVAALLSHAAYADPWLALNVLDSLRGTVANGANYVAVRGFQADVTGMGVHADADSDSSAGHALYTAAQENPRRALALIPRLAPLFTSRRSTGSAQSRLPDYLGRVLNGWVLKDRDGAAAWFAALPEEDRQTILGALSHRHFLNPEATRLLQSLPR